MLVSVSLPSLFSHHAMPYYCQPHNSKKRSSFYWHFFSWVEGASQQVMMVTQVTNANSNLVAILLTSWPRPCHRQAFITRLLYLGAFRPPSRLYALPPELADRRAISASIVDSTPKALSVRSCLQGASLHVHVCHSQATEILSIRLLVISAASSCPPRQLYPV